MRQDTAKSMSKLADQMKEAGPDIPAHQHVRDAARVLRSGNEEAAQRHLRAAIFALTPQSLHRQGVHNDDGHTAARTAMHGVHRHLLLVKDIADVAAKNQRMLARDSYGDLESAPTLPQSPERDGPDAGYGPGALAQKPTARQPGGDRALNAPDRTNSGGSDPNVADPVGPQPKGSKQFGYGWGDLASVIEMAWTGWLHERRNKGGAWTDGGGGTPSAHPGAMNQPAGLDDLARAAANKHPDVVRMVNQSKAAAAAGDMQRSHQLWQQASDLAVQKIQEYKDKAALKSMSGPPTLSSSKIQQELVDNSGDGGDPANDYRFSAETGRLAVTPAPYGKPGGPGLYHVKGLKHSDYLEQIVHALMRKGMDKGKATAIARGSIRRWMRGGGHVHPEVRAAAGVAEAEELKAQARAHAHADTWDEVAAVVELAWRDAFRPDGGARQGRRVDRFPQRPRGQTGRLTIPVRGSGMRSARLRTLPPPVTGTRPASIWRTRTRRCGAAPGRWAAKRRRAGKRRGTRSCWTRRCGSYRAAWPWPVPAHGVTQPGRLSSRRQHLGRRGCRRGRRAAASSAAAAVLPAVLPAAGAEVWHPSTRHCPPRSARPGNV